MPLPTKAGGSTELADPQIPVPSTLVDQAHNAIERKLFAMKGPIIQMGANRRFLTEPAHLYNLMLYQLEAFAK